MPFPLCYHLSSPFFSVIYLLFGVTPKCTQGLLLPGFQGPCVGIEPRSASSLQFVSFSVSSEETNEEEKRKRKKAEEGGHTNQGMEDDEVYSSKVRF